MSDVSFVVAHIMGMPVEETMLFGLPPLAAAFSAWWIQHRAKRAARADAETGSDVRPAALRKAP